MNEINTKSNNNKKTFILYDYEIKKLDMLYKFKSDYVEMEII